MRINLAVFDMIGTTVQAGDEVPSAFRRAFSASGIALTDEGISGIRGRSKHESILELLQAHDVPPERRQEMVGIVYKRFQEFLRAAYGSSAQPIAGTEDVFEFLRGLGVQVVLTTGLDRGTAHVLLQSLGWDSLGLAGLISGDDVSRGRPAPDLIHAAMRLVRVEDPGEVLVVGDTSADLEAAAAAGVGLSIGVLTGAHSLGRLRVRSHSAILESIADLPQWLAEAGAFQKE